VNIPGGWELLVVLGILLVLAVVVGGVLTLLTRGARRR